MDKVSVALTVFFEDPFWIGVLERVSEGELICVQDYLWRRSQRIMR